MRCSRRGTVHKETLGTRRIRDVKHGYKSSRAQELNILRNGMVETVSDCQHTRLHTAL